MKRYKYKDVLPIESYQSTAWLIEFISGRKQIAIWHKDAQIEDIVKATKIQNPGKKFTISVVDVGVFDITMIVNCMFNDRKLNQNMRVVILNDDKYNRRNHNEKY